MNDVCAAATAQSPDPERAEAALESSAAAWRNSGRVPAEFDALLECFPLGAGALAHLLAVSPISVEKLRNEPELMEWLARPEISASDRGPRRMRTELAALRGAEPVFDSRLVALRRLHRRELLRIALREVAGAATLTQTTAELSALADVMLQEALAGWQADCAKRWGGAPATGFAILGLGKLGGRDLNFSSDVDLMFLYGEDAQYRPNFTNLEYFARLGEKLTSSFARKDSAGSLFRLDLRLRPEGKEGPLVTSLAAAENYYAGHGETWERLMLGKVRHVAGDAETTYEFTQRLQPFVYPRSLAPDTLLEIGELKARIEREHRCAEIASPGGNVKLGPGGIREVEFVAGALQLLHGSHQAFLQEANTPKVLAALARLDFLPAEQFLALAEAYSFLRSVEHRLQIEDEAQTHSLPTDAADLERLARSLSFPDTEALFNALRTHTNAVRSVFRELVDSGEASKGATCPFPLFRDPAGAQKQLARIAEPPAGVHAARRTRRLFSRLEPLLIEQLARGADPDAALVRFARFVEAYGIRGLLLEMLIMHPRLLELLVRIFDASEYFASILIRRPSWLEELVDDGALSAALDAPAQLQILRSHANDLTRLRQQQQGALLRIVMRDVLGLAGADPPFAEISQLAEASVLRALEILGLGERVTILGLGKLGGAELSYGADLDVVLLGDDTQAAELLTRSLARTAVGGALFPLDARLRPEGANGPLVCSFAQYASYFRGGRAQHWERQALTKARVIAGARREEASVLLDTLWREGAGHGESRREIRAMLARVIRERSDSDVAGPHFKTGPGGLMAIEFAVQALQMTHTFAEPNTRQAIKGIIERGFLDESEGSGLAMAYTFLRRIESSLRREENKSVSTLPAAEEDRARLGRRLDFDSPAQLLEASRAARAVAARATARILET